MFLLYWIFVIAGLIFAIEIIIKLKIFALIKSLKESSLRSINILRSKDTDEVKQKAILNSSRRLMTLSIKFLLVVITAILIFLIISIGAGYFFLDNINKIFTDLIKIKIQIYIFAFAIIYFYIKIKIFTNGLRNKKL